jgi:clan AA aspartic protease
MSNSILSREEISQQGKELYQQYLRTQIEIECVVDTGFEGFLTLPPAVVTRLGLPYVAPIDANLADNSLIVANVHQGIVIWNGVERSRYISMLNHTNVLHN